MALNYETTNWENGKTVLKAEHLRKIEKGITDIIAENDAVYTGEDIRKSNEEKRQEEHSRKMNEASETVSNIQEDYDSLQRVIIDENISIQLQNQINQTNSQLEHIKKSQNVSVIDFGAKGDGVDDTIAIEKAVEYINKNGGNLFFPIGIFVTSKPITLTKPGSYVIGNTSGWGDDVLASTIKAKDGFTGEYLIGYKGEIYEKIYSRSMGMKNININCNNQNCKAIHVQNLYDGSVWENITITQVNPNYRIFESISTYDNVCQTVTMNNIFACHSVNTTLTNPAEGFYGERWYECTFTNCKFGSRGNSAFKMVGSYNNTYLNCSFMGDGENENSIGLDLFNCNYINIINPTFESPTIALNVDGDNLVRGIKLNNPRALYGKKLNWEVRLNNCIGGVIDLVKPQSGGDEAIWTVKLSNTCKNTVITTDEPIILNDMSENINIVEHGYPKHINTSSITGNIILPDAKIGRRVIINNDGEKNQYIACPSSSNIEGQHDLTMFKGSFIEFICFINGTWSITNYDCVYLMNDNVFTNRDKVFNFVESKQLSYDLTTSTITNVNANKNISFTLSNAKIGIEFNFIKSASYDLTINPVSTQRFRNKSQGQGIDIKTNYKNIKIKCIEENVWDVIEGENYIS